VTVDTSAEQFCRDVETYLCRKNEGHIIRIVGPAFDLVCGWARRGVPLKVAQSGIDRYFERYYAKGPRRRPVRVEFCEADVLDVFDEWRRATGVPLVVDAEESFEQGGEPASSGRLQAGPTPASHLRAASASLPVHLDRVIARLTTLRAGEDRSLDEVLESAVQELDAARSAAKAIRGGARESLLQRLHEIDRTLLEAVRARATPELLVEVTREADEELAGYRDRMLPAAYERSRAASVDRLLRERRRLPVVAFE
jgi:hypothetical protein